MRPKRGKRHFGKTGQDPLSARNGGPCERALKAYQPGADVFRLDTKYFQTDDLCIGVILPSLEQVLRDLHDVVSSHGFEGFVCNVICVSAPDRPLGISASMSVPPYPDKEVVLTLEIRRDNVQSVSAVAELDYDNGIGETILDQTSQLLMPAGILPKDALDSLAKLLSSTLHRQLNNIEDRLRELEQN